MCICLGMLFVVPNVLPLPLGWQSICSQIIIIIIICSTYLYRLQIKWHYKKNTVFLNWIYFCSQVRGGDTYSVASHRKITGESVTGPVILSTPLSEHLRLKLNTVLYILYIFTCMFIWDSTTKDSEMNGNKHFLNLICPQFQHKFNWIVRVHIFKFCRNVQIHHLLV
jgi:hypothetical protein